MESKYTHIYIPTLSPLHGISDELKAIDAKSRRLSSPPRNFYANIDSQRPNLKRKQGSKGFSQIQTTIDCLIISLRQISKFFRGSSLHTYDIMQLGNEDHIKYFLVDDLGYTTEEAEQTLPQ